MTTLLQSLKPSKLDENVFDNIKKAVAYLFAGNLVRSSQSSLPLAIGWANPFTALRYFLSIW